MEKKGGEEKLLAVEQKEKKRKEKKRKEKKRKEKKRKKKKLKDVRKPFAQQ